MKVKNAGVFTFPDTINRGIASYSVPGMIVKSEKSVKPTKQINVTHKVFFGENVKRAINLLKSK